MDKVSILKEPTTGMMYKICEKLIEEDLDNSEENILAIREQLEIFSTWRDTTVVNKFMTENNWYYETLLECKSSECYLLTKQQLANVLAVGASLLNNPRTKDYFIPKENEKIYKHVDIYFNYKGVDCKGELDMLTIDFHNRTMQFYDIKTTGKSTRYFSQSVKDFRYDIQAACYTIALQHVRDGKALCPKLEGVDFTDFIILPPIFLVESTDPDYIGVCPMPYRASAEMLRAGMHGVYADKRFTVTGPADRMLLQTIPLIPGFDTLIEDYIWYQTRPEEDRSYTRIEVEQMDATGAITLSPW